MKYYQLFLPALVLAVRAWAADPAAPLPAMGDNESLVYRVSWAIIPGAGEISISAHAASDPAGTPLMRIVTRTATRGLAHLILPFDARAESLFDTSSGRLIWLGETSTNRSVQAAHTVTFDYAKSVANYVDGRTPGASQVLPMPQGYPGDLINCLVQSRTWNVIPGQTHDALVLFEDEFYQLTIHAIDYETIDTSLGSFRTLVLEPRMEKTPPKGMFKRGSKVRVWIAQDPRHLPVRFKVEFKVGSGTATLAQYRPPAAPIVAPLRAASLP